MREKNMNIKVSASILSADFSCLEKELKRIERARADMVHIDVMDGHFVPNITIGPVVVKDIRRVTKMPLDVHLMIKNPLKYVDDFIKAGSDLITLHIETISKKELLGLKEKLRNKGVKMGVSLNPSTPCSKIKGILKEVDFILVMSVDPGFSGQAFMEKSVLKIREIRELFKGDIAVDGGINGVTAKKVVKAGANILAAGSFIFQSGNYDKAIRSLKCQH